MAQVITADNKLKEKHDHYQKRRRGAFMLTMGSFLIWMLNIFFIHSFNPLFLFSVFISFFIGGVSLSYLSKQVESLSSGLQGEEKTAAVAAMLPQEYYCIRNPKVTWEDRTSEMDIVIVGKTGVFIVESKNHNGTIIGDYTKNQWVQHKIGQKGTPYSSQFYSPVKQVSTHVYRLANMLHSRGIHTYIQAIVYFTNPDTEVFLENQENKISVFSAVNGGKEALLSSVLESPQCLTQAQVVQIVKLIINSENNKTDSVAHSPSLP